MSRDFSKKAKLFFVCAAVLLGVFCKQADKRILSLTAHLNFTNMSAALTPEAAQPFPHYRQEPEFHLRYAAAS